MYSFDEVWKEENFAMVLPADIELIWYSFSELQKKNEQNLQVIHVYGIWYMQPNAGFKRCKGTLDINKGIQYRQPETEIPFVRHGLAWEERWAFLGIKG